MSRLIVHIGPQRTGSTAIQNWCRANRWKLLKTGYVYCHHWRAIVALGSPWMARMWASLLCAVSFVTGLRFILSTEGHCGPIREMRAAVDWHIWRLGQIVNGLPATVVWYARTGDSTRESIYRLLARRRWHYDIPAGAAFGPAKVRNAVSRWVKVPTIEIEYERYRSVSNFLAVIAKPKAVSA